MKFFPQQQQNRDERIVSSAPLQQQKAEIWGVALVAAAGTGAAIYGANKQAKAQAAASKEQNAANAQNTQATNDYNWANYLMTRGVAPMRGTVSAGELPGPENTRVVNTKLPLWATTNIGTAANNRGQFIGLPPITSTAKTTRSVLSPVN